MSKKIPNIINTMRTAKSMFAPSDSYVPFDIQNPEHVGVSECNGLFTIFVTCRIGNADVEASVKVKSNGEARVTVRANFGAPGAQSAAELVLWMDTIKQVTDAVCRVEVYLNQRLNNSYVDLDAIKNWMNNND